MTTAVSKAVTTVSDRVTTVSDRVTTVSEQGEKASWHLASQCPPRLRHILWVWHERRNHLIQFLQLVRRDPSEYRLALAVVWFMPLRVEEDLTQGCGEQYQGNMLQ